MLLNKRTIFHNQFYPHCIEEKTSLAHKSEQDREEACSFQVAIRLAFDPVFRETALEGIYEFLEFFQSPEEFECFLPPISEVLKGWRSGDIPSDALERR